MTAESKDIEECFYLLYQGDISNYDVQILELIDNKGVQKFKYGIEWKQHDEIPIQFRPLLPEGQIVAAGDWILHNTIDDEGIDKYFVIMERVSGYVGRSTQPLYVRLWLYKDNTEYYKTLYPTAGVRSVVVAQALSNRPIYLE